MYEIISFSVNRINNISIELFNWCNIMRGGIILRQILIVLISLDISLGVCVQENDNYPPPDKTVVLDSTNLPIVFLNVGGGF